MHDQGVLSSWKTLAVGWPELGWVPLGLLDHDTLRMNNYLCFSTQVYGGNWSDGSTQEIYDQT